MRDIITRLDLDEKFQLFKRLYAEGNNTYNRMCKRLEQDNLPIHINSTEVFEDLERELKQESFALDGHKVAVSYSSIGNSSAVGKYFRKSSTSELPILNYVNWLLILHTGAMQSFGKQSAF